MKRCRNFAAYERAEQKKSRKLAFRAAVQSGTSSFRAVCKNCETGDSVGCIGTVRVLFMG
jgi:hypothetical protein